MVVLRKRTYCKNANGTPSAHVRMLSSDQLQGSNRESIKFFKRLETLCSLVVMNDNILHYITMIDRDYENTSNKNIHMTFMHCSLKQIKSLFWERYLLFITFCYLLCYIRRNSEDFLPLAVCIIVCHRYYLLQAKICSSVSKTQHNDTTAEEVCWYQKL